MIITAQQLKEQYSKYVDINGKALSQQMVDF